MNLDCMLFAPPPQWEADIARVLDGMIVPLAAPIFYEQIAGRVGESPAVVERAVESSRVDLSYLARQGWALRLARQGYRVWTLRDHLVALAAQAGSANDSDLFEWADAAGVLGLEDEESDLIQLSPDDLCRAYRAELWRLYGVEIAWASQVEYCRGWFYIKVAKRLPDQSLSVLGTPITARKKDVASFVMRLRRRTAKDNA